MRGGLTTLRLTVEYRGGGFHGFQWQPGLRTVAGVLEEALGKRLREPIKVTGAGRTDAGVHATGQVVSLTTSAAFAFERLPVALNGLLPADCSVRDASVVDDTFSARFSALERTYMYAILNRPQRSAMTAPTAWHVPYALDLDAMHAAAQHFIGEHDFIAFCAAAAAKEAASTSRDIGRLCVQRHGEMVRIEITANAFLHRMVRTIVGTLVECGRGRRSSDEVPHMLASRDCSAVGPVAPAHGLYLAGVRYDAYDSFAEPPLFTHPLSSDRV